MGKLCALLALVLLLAVPSAAQEQRGSIEGTVRDSSGGVLPGTTVEARSPSQVGVTTAVTDAQGIFRFPALAPGRYTVKATLDAFQPAAQENITLELGQLLGAATGDPPPGQVQLLMLERR
jgi:hypothetical protein